MKRSLLILAVISLLAVGCGAISKLVDLIPGESAQPPAPVAIASYAPLTPAADLGSDGLGNYWIRHTVPDTLCEIITLDARDMVFIHCPAEGDTLR